MSKPCPPLAKCLCFFKCFFRNDGRVCAFGVILVSVSVVVFPDKRKRIGGVGFLAEGVSNIFLVLYCQAGTNKNLRKLSVVTKIIKTAVATNYTFIR